jgi:CYTH domain-containing protein
MAIEIEHKFLVTSNDWRINEPVQIRQGYLNRDPDRTVRVRTAGNQAWITVKGRTTGSVRSEFEYPIPLNDADALLLLCERPLLEKRRYHFEHDGRTWEVDEFLGENEGLVVAEIELDTPDAEFSMPSWIGVEVTHDSRYFNSNLSVNPFTTWK